MLKLTYKLIYYFDYSLFLWNANKGTFPRLFAHLFFPRHFFFLLNRQSLFSIIIFVLYYDYFLAKNLRSRRASRFVLVNFLAIVSQNHIESSTRWGFFFFVLLPFCLYSQHSSNKHYLPVTFNITEISTIIFWLLLILFFIGVPNIHRFVSCVCSVLASIWCCFLFVAFKKSFICFPFRFISDKHC